MYRLPGCWRAGVCPRAGRRAPRAHHDERAAALGAGAEAVLRRLEAWARADASAERASEEARRPSSRPDASTAAGATAAPR